MKLTVWKFPLDLSKLTANGELPPIHMPIGAEILTAREQGETICVWARVNPKETRVVKRMFAVCGTGHDAPFTDYVGTGLLFGGTLVLHVFLVAAGTRSVAAMTTERRPLPEPTPGQLLSAMERAASDFRTRVALDMWSAGPHRTADLINGFKHGWEAAVAFIKAEAPQ